MRLENEKKVSAICKGCHYLRTHSNGTKSCDYEGGEEPYCSRYRDYKEVSPKEKEQELARKIFDEIETNLSYRFINGETHLVIREKDYNQCKKKCIGE